jgi:hypothetical protein
MVLSFPSENEHHTAEERWITLKYHHGHSCNWSTYAAVLLCPFQIHMELDEIKINNQEIDLFFE